MSKKQLMDRMLLDHAMACIDVLLEALDSSLALCEAKGLCEDAEYIRAKNILADFTEVDPAQGVTS